MVRMVSAGVEWGFENLRRSFLQQSWGIGKKKERVYPNSTYLQAFIGNLSGANTLAARLWRLYGSFLNFVLQLQAVLLLVLLLIFRRSSILAIRVALTTLVSMET